MGLFIVNGRFRPVLILEESKCGCQNNCRLILCITVITISITVITISMDKDNSIKICFGGMWQTTAFDLQLRIVFFKLGIMHKLHTDNETALCKQSSELLHMSGE